MGRTVSTFVGRQRIVALDSGALIALSREDVNAAALVAQLRRFGATMVVPAPVLAEVLRGTSRDALVHRVLRVFDADKPTTAAAARAAGNLLGQSRSEAKRTVDALIIATAIEHGATAVVTRDERDFTALAPRGLAVLGL